MAFTREGIKARLNQRLGEEYIVCRKEAITELAPEIKREYEELARNEIMKWYSAYTPMFYGRRMSMLNIPYGEVNLSDWTFEMAFRSGLMGKDRKGGDLYEKVFIGGWHGGAWAGDTFRYRRPVNKWYVWGRQAVRTESAFDMYNADQEALSEKWREKILERTMEKLIPKIPDILWEVF